MLFVNTSPNILKTGLTFVTFCIRCAVETRLVRVIRRGEISHGFTSGWIESNLWYFQSSVCVAGVGEEPIRLVGWRPRAQNISEWIPITFNHRIIQNGNNCKWKRELYACFPFEFFWNKIFSIVFTDYVWIIIYKELYSLLIHCKEKIITYISNFECMQNVHKCTQINSKQIRLNQIKTNKHRTATLTFAFWLVTMYIMTSWQHSHVNKFQLMTAA